MGRRSGSSGLVVMLLVVVCAGCAVRATKPARAPAEPASGESSGTLSALEVQQVVMEMADDHIAALGEAIYLAAENVRDDRRARKMAQSFLRNGVGACIDIATHRNPEVGLFDMVVLVSLQTWAFETHWMPQGIGVEAGVGALERLRESEAKTWETASSVLSPLQREELRRLIEQWIAANPNQTVVSFVRFDEFLDDRALPQKEPRQRASLLLREWRSTITAVEDAILFGERALWFAGRYPYVLGQQVELTAYRLADQPEYRDIERALQSLDALSTTTADLSARLPEDPVAAFEDAASRVTEHAVEEAFSRVAREREAILRVLEAREGELAPLLAELRQVLSASSDLAQESRGTIETLDHLLSRFQDAGGGSPEPIDLVELRMTLTEAGVAAESLARLLEQTNEALGSPAWDARLAEAGSLSSGLIDRSFWRALILVVVFLAGLALVLRYAPREARG